MPTTFTPLRAVHKALIKVSALLSLCLLYTSSYAQSAVLKNIELNNTKERQTEIILQLDKAPVKIQSYQLDNPSRLVIDLFDTQNQLPQRYFRYNQAQVKTISGVQANDRTRLVFDLNAPTSFRSKVIDNQVRINLGDLQPLSRINPSTSTTAHRPPTARIQDIDFRRGENNTGLLTLQLDQPNSAFMLQESAKGRLELKLTNLYLPTALRRTLDVKDFSTPVQRIRVQQSRENAALTLDLKGSYNYIAYQTGRQLTLEIKPVSEEEKNLERQKKFPYTGDKLTLNFQDIDIRAVLQIIAETTNLNLVTSDSVSGNVTLRLEQVPWDQALQLVMDSKGLASRKTGNVLLVAPAEELAERERQELKANLDTRELAELEAEFIQIQYAKASEIAAILNGVDENQGGLLSKRGRALVDERTNTILVQDVPSSLLEIKSVVKELDIPIQQVLIEARIVSARSNIGSELGVRWGGGSSSAIDTGVKAIGESSLTVDLGVRSGGSFNFNPGTGSFALGYADSSILVDMELAALASEGKGEIISQPKVITANKRKAVIKSGKQIPYREESSSGGTKIAFKDAVLSLEVTPQITPDEHIIMDLKITQDALGNQEFDGAPAIDTNAIETQVLVNDGDTIVLGGIYTSESITQNFKVPFLGDLPLLGNLFKRSEKSQEKVELLIFITPRLIEDSVSLN